MHKPTQNLHWALILLASIAIAIAATTLPAFHHSPSAALAQQNTIDPSASKGCYNNTFAMGDFAHCYLFEEAENQGRIKIESIYLEPSNALHIFIARTEPIDDELATYFETTAHQYMEESTRRYHQAAQPNYDGTGGAPLPGWLDHSNICKGLAGQEKTECFNIIMGDGSSHGLWDEFHHLGSSGFPNLNGYANVFMHTGGTEGRKKVPGWASWRQVWPDQEEEQPEGIPDFDVSTVDTENIPELVCDDVYYYNDYYITTSCRGWEDLPDLGVGAVHGRRHNRFKGTAYYHLTTPIPTKEEELEALKQKIYAGYETTEWDMILIPTKYDFGQLWKWKVILERFAVSDANTIGITFVQIHTNHELNYSDITSAIPPIWAGGIRPAKTDKLGFIEDWTALRNILVLATADPHKTADALPHLLPLLGIPVHAVGVILYDERRPTRFSVLKEESDIPQDSNRVVSENSQDPSPNDQTDSPSADVPPPTENAPLKVQPPKEEPDAPSAPQSNFNQTNRNQPITQTDQTPADRPSQGGVTEGNRPSSDSETNTLASSETENSQWPIIAIAALAGLIALGLVTFLGLRLARRRS